MATNSEIEQRWVDAWNDLFDIVNDRRDVNCLLPDGRVVDIDTFKGWLQDSAYQGWQIKVTAGPVLGQQGIVASKWRSGGLP
jgi:hypothetical protein